MAGLGLLVLSGHSGDPSAAAPIAGLIALYSVGAYAEGRAGVAGAGAVLAVVWTAVGADRDGRSFGNFLFFGIGVGGPWAAGVALRLHRTSERTLRAHAERLTSDRDETARRAVTEERQRVARELHDVVAHSISVIVLQARGGRSVLDDAPEEAREAFDSIEATGREALTNTLRHAGPAQARVVVQCAADCVQIEVSDDGSGPNGGDPGHGLAGIRERVSLYGGAPHPRRVSHDPERRAGHRSRG